MPESTYPLFIPPDSLTEKPRTDWSKKEAERYKEWLLNSADDRVGKLLEYFAIDPREHEPINLLLRLGELVTAALCDEPFSKVGAEGQPWLTNAGYALAADMGLLTARLLITETEGRVRWEVLRKPKSDMSYNLPVLTGFGKVTFDPIGSSVAEAQGVLGGRRGADAWARILEFWKALADCR